jgi:ribosomal protein S18 acetylase RimI-like enzyme
MLTVGVYRTPSGNKAWIEDVVIDELFRGMSYGEKIVLHAIDFIRSLDADTISLTSNSSRIAANRLNQKLGFEQYETNVYKMKLTR